MRLSEFILKNQEPILQAWEEFARSVDTPMPAMGPLGLRDHAEYILRSVALDMCTSQTPQEQIDKSHGLKPVTADESAAQSHAITRLMAGFTLDQMVSEYRALRSSVLRLWLTQEFSVQNHGKPIPANELPSLFNPERRYSKYSEGEQGASSGLGLGLFIAAQIVEGHGGTIEVESTLERGTIFRVNLPCRNRSP